MSDISPSKVTVNQVGAQIMRYWPALVIIVLMIAAGAEVRLRVQQHSEVLKAIQVKLTASETDKQQWLLLRSLVEDNVSLDGRMDDVEEHITPTSIQKWGAIQNTVEEDHRLLTNHLLNHGRP